MKIEEKEQLLWWIPALACVPLGVFAAWAFAWDANFDRPLAERFDDWEFAYVSVIALSTLGTVRLVDDRESRASSIGFLAGFCAYVATAVTLVLFRSFQWESRSTFGLMTLLGLSFLTNLSLLVGVVLLGFANKRED